ncbi:MAG: metallophosphoesterase [Oscillospiraceae bacterium]|nr:metallophosphoesterase [Oscillospiraceae bacterium]
MAVFAIADLHLSLGVEKPMDIFEGWGDYTERLRANWTDAVGAQDTVVVPGDVSWGMTLEQAAPDFDFIERLPGRKIILKGNHDYWWQTRKKLEDFKAARGYTTIDFLFNDSYVVGDVGICGTRSWFYDEAQSDRVFQRELGRLKMSLDDLAQKSCGERVAFLHYPPVYRGFRCPEIIELLRAYGVRRCYYGHIHGDSIAWAYNGNCGGVEFRLVSADNLQFRPYLIR